MVPTMRAMIVTMACVVLGTLVVLSGGRGGSSSRHHTRSGDLAADLLRTAHDTSYDYDPSSKPCYTDQGTYPGDGYGCGTPASYIPSEHFCYADNDNPGKYCWWPIDRYPCGDWKGVAAADRGYSTDCGRLCTTLTQFNHPRKYQPICRAAVYDPHEDFCFSDEDNPGKYCWCPKYKIPYGNWRVNGDRGFNQCGFNHYGGKCDGCSQEINN
jgi:hypothetical protein